MCYLVCNHNLQNIEWLERKLYIIFVMKTAHTYNFLNPKLYEPNNLYRMADTSSVNETPKFYPNLSKERQHSDANVYGMLLLLTMENPYFLCNQNLKSTKYVEINPLQCL